MKVFLKLGRTEQGKLTILVYGTDNLEFAIINNLKEDFDFGQDPTLPEEHAALIRNSPSTPPGKPS